MTWARIKAWAVVAALVLAVAVVWLARYAARLSARLASTQRSLEAQRAAARKDAEAFDAFRAATRDGEARRADIDAAAEATRTEIRGLGSRTLLELAIWHDRARGRK